MRLLSGWFQNYREEIKTYAGRISAGVKSVFFLLVVFIFSLSSQSNAGAVQIHYEQIPQQIFFQSSGYYTKFARAITDITWRGIGDDILLTGMYGDHYFWDIEDPYYPFAYAREFAPPWVTSSTGLLITAGNISRVYGQSNPVASWLDSQLGYFGFGLYTCESQTDFSTCQSNNQLGWTMQSGPLRYLGSGTSLDVGTPIQTNGNNLFRAFYNLTGASRLYTGTDIDYTALADGFDNAQWVTSSEIEYFTQDSSDPVKSLDINAFSIFPGRGNSISYVAGNFNYSSASDYGEDLTFYTTRQYTTDELNNGQVVIGGREGFLTIPVYDLSSEMSITQGKTLVLAKSPANNPSAGPIPTLGGIQYTVYDCVSSDPNVLTSCPYISAGILKAPSGQTTGLLQGGNCTLGNLIYENNCPSMYLFYMLGMHSDPSRFQNFTFGKVASIVTSTGVFFPSIPTIQTPTNSINTNMWFGFEAISGYPPILGGQAPGTNFTPFNGPATAGTIGALLTPYCQLGVCIMSFPTGFSNFNPTNTSGIFFGDPQQFSGILSSGFQYCSDETRASIHPDFCGALFSGDNQDSSTSFLGADLFSCPTDFANESQGFELTLEDIFGTTTIALLPDSVTDNNILGPFSCMAGAIAVGYQVPGLRSLFSGYNRIVPTTNNYSGNSNSTIFDLLGNLALAGFAVFLSFYFISKLS